MRDADPEAEINDEADVDLSDESEADFLPSLYTIVSFGADFDVTSVVSRLEKGDIEIPKFQRDYVWTRRQASRFIESLLMGLPVPGIFLWRQPSTQKLFVIDGGQRLRTLQAYYRELLLGKEFKILPRTSPYQEVHPRFQNQTYRTLDDEDRRRLDNSIIHATIINQESPPQDDSSIYYIFERLNTEGTPLQPQEIRTAVFQGPLIDLVAQLNQIPDWRDVFGRYHPRMKDRELILRFFALYFADLSLPSSRAREPMGEQYAYARPMKEFLNRYCQFNSALNHQSAATLTELFTKSIGLIHSGIGAKAFRRANALNVAVFDAVMVGTARRLQRGEVLDKEQFRIAYEGLVESADFVRVSSRATADYETVTKRIELATEAFSAIP